MKKILLASCFMILVSALASGMYWTVTEPASVFAQPKPMGPFLPQQPNPTSQVPQQPNPTSDVPQQPNPTQTGFSFNVQSPLLDESLMCLIYRLFKIFMNIFAIVAGLYILYSGFKFIAAQGNPTKLQIARQNFYNVIIGTALILGSWGIVILTVNTINEILDEPIADIPSNATCE